MIITSKEQFTNDFRETILKLTTNKEFSSLIFLCIGTDRVIGDCFGPIVGYKLKEGFYGIENIHVIGDLENIVCSMNIKKIIEKICQEYSNPFIISIDSALSTKSEDIGKIFVGRGGVTIGNSMGYGNFVIGDMFIKGVIAQNFGKPKYNFRELQNTRLNQLVKMANIVSNGIFETIEVIK